MSSVILNANKMYLNLNITQNVNIDSNLSVSGNVLIKGNLDLTNNLLTLGHNTDNVAKVGSIRYNPDKTIFEGFGPNNSWGSLGGVSDIDKNTKIIAETSAGANNDELLFYTANKNNNNDNLPYIRMNLSGSNIHSNLNIYNGDDNLSHYLNILVGQSSQRINYSDSFKIQRNESDKFVIDSSNNIIFTNISSESMRISNTQNVGIGTNNPLTKLHINSTDGLIIPVGNTTPDRPIAKLEHMGMIRYNNEIKTFEGCDGNNWGSLGGVIDVDQDTYVSAENSASENNNQLRFFTEGEERMFIGNSNESGNIGIGTNNPLSTLHIKGTNGLIIPVGNTTPDRPIAKPEHMGMIRYNNEIKTFEGCDGNNWGSLGGVIDVSQDTYVSAENSANENNDQLRFFTQGVERMFIGNSNQSGTLNILSDTHFSGHLIPNNNIQYDIGTPYSNIRDLYLSSDSLWLGNTYKICVNSEGELKIRKRITDSVPPSILEISPFTENNDIKNDIFSKYPLINNLSEMKLTDWLDYGKLFNSNFTIQDLYRIDNPEDFEYESNTSSLRTNSNNDVYIQKDNLTDIKLGLGTNIPETNFDIKSKNNVEILLDSSIQTFISYDINNFNSSINFDSNSALFNNNNYIQFPTNISTNLGGINLTIEFDALFNNVSSKNVILSQGINIDYQYLMIYLNNNNLYFEIASSTVAIYDISNEINKMTHYAFTYSSFDLIVGNLDSGSWILNCFVNGLPITPSNIDTNQFNYIKNGTNSTGFIRLGSSTHTSNPSKYLTNASLKLLKIWRISLSQSYIFDNKSIDLINKVINNDPSLLNLIY